MEDDGFDATKDYVRVGVKSGGCSGLSYDLTFDNKKGEDDKVFEENNVRLIVDKKSFLYLVGTTLEYSGGLTEKVLYLTTQMPIELVVVESLLVCKSPS